MGRKKQPVPEGPYVFTDPQSGATWAHDVGSGVNWAQAGVFALVRGHRSLPDALADMFSMQPFLMTMYGTLSAVTMSGAWDPRNRTYHKFGVMRVVSPFELDAVVLESPHLVQPLFFEVKAAVGYPVHSFEVADKVKSYLGTSQLANPQ